MFLIKIWWWWNRHLECPIYTLSINGLLKIVFISEWGTRRAQEFGSGFYQKLRGSAETRLEDKNGELNLFFWMRPYDEVTASNFTVNMKLELLKLKNFESQTQNQIPEFTEANRGHSNAGISNGVFREFGGNSNRPFLSTGLPESSGSRRRFRYFALICSG